VTAVNFLKAYLCTVKYVVIYGRQMIFGLFKQHGALNSVPVFSAFEQGIRHLGHTAHDNDLNADVAVIWSVLWYGRMSKNKAVWDHFTKQGKPIIVLEVGALKRNITWKVAVGGINNEAYFGHTTNNDNARLTSLGITVQDWKDTKDTNSIIICGQHQASHQWRHMPPASDWIANTIREIRQYTDRLIKVRSHPRHPFNFNNKWSNVIESTPKRIDIVQDFYDFGAELSNAHCVVNWSSNPAIEAALAGVPVFTGPDSLAHAVANHSFDTIETPIKPNRQQWANDLAYTEWTVDEIAKSIPLIRILNKINT
jgi:hypothetical protein